MATLVCVAGYKNGVGDVKIVEKEYFEDSYEGRQEMYEWIDNTWQFNNNVDIYRKYKNGKVKFVRREERGF